MASIVAETRTDPFFFAYVALSIAAAAALAWAQESSWTFNRLGHSLVLYLALALVPASSDRRSRALIGTPLVLVGSVAAYYVALLVHGYYRLNADFLTRLGYWLVAAAIGAAVLVVIAQRAVRSDDVLTWPSRGVIVGSSAPSETR